jgi:hypothetical protein
MTQRLPTLALLCMLAGAASAADDSAALRAKYAELREELSSNAFRSPVHLASREEAGRTSGDVYAILRKPFGETSAALEQPAAWCDILFLHLNTKFCRAGAGQPALLDMAIGKKHDQPLDEAYRMSLAFSVASRSPEYLRILMTAGEGPLSTRDYRIVFEAVPLEDGRSFIHLSYAYGYGLPSKIAASAYLSTVGSNKVGFTVAGRGADGSPQYIGGMRGVVERNTMRYYLAIESYLRAAAGAPREAPARLVRRHRALPAPAARDRPVRVPRHEAPRERPPVMKKENAMFKMQVQEDPDDTTSWHDVRDASGKVMTFEQEEEARSKLEALFPVQVKLEKYSGPKTTRVIAILKGTHDSRPMR